MHKLLTCQEAVARFVRPGAVIGLGGQNINRCPMALVHEITRQAIDGLTIVGCNLSLPLDLLVARGLVARTEQGTGNLERYGTLFSWRRAAERGDVVTVDHSHLAMATRFAAGALGLPFLPTKSLLGTTLLEELISYGCAQPYEFDGEPIVLMRALRPDVSIIHVNRADEAGNVIIEGVTSHEVDMVRASAATIVSAEEVLPAGAFSDRPERVTISEAHVDAVVAQPYGAFPTSVYRAYDFAEADVQAYQKAARAGEAEAWIKENVLDPGSFEGYLDLRDPHGELRKDLAARMEQMI